MDDDFVMIPDVNTLEPHIKMFAVKTTQVIVQSRMKQKSKTIGSPIPIRNDWFGLRIDDQPEVLAETEKVLQVKKHESVVTRLPLNVEISLQTPDEDSIVLEVWTLSVQTDNLHPKPLDVIHRELGVVLKLILTTTRMIPAYRLARKQDEDSYQIYYRIYTGERMADFGNEAMRRVVGEVPSQTGTITMSVVYLKSVSIDDFRPNLTSATARNKQNDNDMKVKERKIDLNQPMSSIAFVDTKKTKQVSEIDLSQPSHSAYRWLFTQNRAIKTAEPTTPDNESAPEEQTICSASPQDIVKKKTHSPEKAAQVLNSEEKLHEIKYNDIDTLKTKPVSKFDLSQSKNFALRWLFKGYKDNSSSNAPEAAESTTPDREPTLEEQASCSAVNTSSPTGSVEHDGLSQSKLVNNECKDEYSSDIPVDESSPKEQTICSAASVSCTDDSTGDITLQPEETAQGTSDGEEKLHGRKDADTDVPPFRWTITEYIDNNSSNAPEDTESTTSDSQPALVEQTICSSVSVTSPNYTDVDLSQSRRLYEECKDDSNFNALPEGVEPTIPDNESAPEEQTICSATNVLSLDDTVYNKTLQSEEPVQGLSDNGGNLKDEMEDDTLSDGSEYYDCPSPPPVLQSSETLNSMKVTEDVVGDHQLEEEPLGPLDNAGEPYEKEDDIPSDGSVFYECISPPPLLESDELPDSTNVEERGGVFRAIISMLQDTTLALWDNEEEDDD
ncbi:autophagy-related protein 13-like [Toxorhynchites rutilus septentrionalis]|uniref:autophagy-related protein 13-like n=1 Tax=Toxorhynchites rutilus septentrionalis TaxID=329112 RepID=UPI00247885E4|nr:autophagy-related protein 13-like [Toxorhynchites rutilus septentrionalis]